MPKKKTFKEFKKEIYELVGNEYSLLSTEYVNNKTKVKMKHNKCGHEYDVTPDMFMRGRRCPKCANIKRNISKRKDKEEFKKEFNDVSNEEYILLDDYISDRNKVRIKHKLCNKIFKMRPYNFISLKQKCPYCNGSFLKTTEEFKKEVEELTDNEYSILSEYINNKTKIKVKHNKCEKEYSVTPYHFIQGRRCPYCNSSKGEERIRKYLNIKNIYFQEQYSFPDCKNIYPLKFDFYLEDDSGRIILIEYDGKQHFKGYFIYDEDKFNKQKLRDKIKDDYCNNHDNIDLYRISYKDFNNIESILEEIINKYN